MNVDFECEFFAVDDDNRFGSCHTKENHVKDAIQRIHKHERAQLHLIVPFLLIDTQTRHFISILHIL